MMDKGRPESGGFLKSKKSHPKDGATPGTKRTHGEKRQRLQKLSEEGKCDKDGGQGGAGRDKPAKKPFDKKKWRENKYSNKVKG